MEKKWIIVAGVGILIIALSYFVMSPSDKIAEEMSENYIENAIENQSGGNVDVNLDDNSYSIETEEGSFKTGEDVTLPADFPGDVYVHEGKLLSVMETSDQAIYISIETDKSPTQVKETYIEKFKADGWEQTGTMDFGDTASIIGKKGERELSVVINRSTEGITNIALTVVQGQ